MKLYKICATLLAVCLMVSCSDDDVVSTSSVQEGLAAKVNLNIEVPATQDVSITRSLSDTESDVTELALLMFCQTSPRVEFLDLTKYLGTKSAIDATTGNYEYTLTQDVDTKSGTYNIYAIANWSSNFCNIKTEDLEAISSESVLQALLASNTDYATQITGDNRLPMSQYLGQEDIIPESEDPDGTANKLSIKLRRIVSHIQFVFQNDESEDNTENPDFTPLYYSVYNMPQSANLIDQRQINHLGTEVAKYTDDINAENLISNSSYGSLTNATASTSFDFFMLENVRDKSTTCTSYNDRDAWDYDEGETHSRTFTNAPDNSTYIVVEGTYVGTTYSGNVSYIIHLGDFSQANSYDYKNFTVNRNEYHTYTVTVKGVNSIVTEAEKDGETHGYEGNVTKSKNNFILDAHYETVMLKIPEKYLYSSTDDGTLTLRTDQKLRLLTPKTGMEYKYYTMSELSNSSDVDYKWVQFQKPDKTTEFPIYAGIDTSTGACLGTGNRKWGYITDLVASPEDYCLKVTSDDDGVIYYTTAFVDEYVYSGSALSSYVQVDNRSFLFDPEDIKESTDKQSIVTEDYGFLLQQRSIKSTYTLSETNPFGIETWDETGAMTWPAENIGSSLSLSLYEGYANTVKFLNNYGGTNSYAYTYGFYADCGYLNPVSTNNTEDHVWNQKSVTNPIAACLTRNRDLNGNGQIDESEIRWYMPGLYQYYILWLGNDALQDDTKLFDASLFDDANYDTDDTSLNKLYTSSGDTYLIYWPDQGAVNSAYGDLDSNYLGTYHKIRCCRNLGTDYTASITQPVKADTDNNKIYVEDVLAIRSTTITDNYGYHYEVDDENEVPEAFEYASSVISMGSSIDASTSAALYSYVTNAFSEGWRMPNQRELMLIYMYALSDITTTSLSALDIIPSTTWSSTGRTNPFTIQRNSGSTATFRLNLLGSWNNVNAYAILVRDTSSSNNSSNTVSYDSGYTSGGTAFGIE